MTKIDISSNLLQYIFFLSNINVFKCCICDKIPNKLYMICKPDCTKFSYCKDCVYKIENLYHKCPFTRTEFVKNDIGLDYRNNESLEIYKKYNKNSIKSINCNILFNTSSVIENVWDIKWWVNKCFNWYLFKILTLNNNFYDKNKYYLITNL